MAARKANGKTVVARTQAAKHVLNNAELLKQFGSNYGRKEDLESVVKHGLEVEAFSTARGQAFSAGKGATSDVLVAFATLQREYNAVMGGVLAVIGDLKRAPNPNLAAIAEAERIYKNETPIFIKTTDGADGRKRSATRLQSQEAVRSEIASDVDALLAFEAGRAALEARGITTAVLTGLKTDAENLSGKLATRTATKGASKDVTEAERNAMAAQSSYWASCYRILALTAANDGALQKLLKEAKA